MDTTIHPAEEFAPLALDQIETDVPQAKSGPAPPPTPPSGVKVPRSPENKLSNVRGADEKILAPEVRTIDLSELGRPFIKLGSGEFCAAFNTSLDGRTVVVKMLKTEQHKNPTASRDLHSEIHLMTEMNHPNVLSSVATGKDSQGYPFLVVEKLAAVLSNELPKSAESVPSWTRKAQCKKWPMSRALHVARELAAALRYCHEEALPGYRILHRDLKPNNIGFMPDGRLVLFDFGLAKLWKISEGDDGSELRTLTGKTGALRYMAPEVALSRPYSHKAEIFAWATMLWQFLSHETPYADCDVDAFYFRVCSKGERPKIPKHAPQALREILEQCWHQEPASRPEMSQVIPKLDGLIDGLQKGLTYRWK